MVSPEMFRVEISDWGISFQCPSCKEGKNIDKGDRELITASGRIEEVDEFCYLRNVLDSEAGLEITVRARAAVA